MNRILIFIIITIINTGLLQARQEAPVVPKALRDTLQERLKQARRHSTNFRAVNFGLARRHIASVLTIDDTLHLADADLWLAAGDVEDQAFNYERNKPALGAKTDPNACLAYAKQCYTYYMRAYELYDRQPERYGKAGLRQQQRIRQLAMQYYLLTNGFQANAGVSHQRHDHATTRQEFLMMLDGSRHPMLLEAYRADPRRNADFQRFQSDTTQCRALYNCATLSSVLGQLDTALAFYDSLKLRGYDPDRVYRQVIAIHSSRRDTAMVMTQLAEAIQALPSEIWYQKSLLQIYLDRQQWAEAQRMADLCFATDSLDAQTLAVRGQLCEIRGDLPGAMTSYLRSYAIDSTQANVCSYIGRIHYNRAVSLRQQLYDQRRFKQIDAAVQPIYDQALPWYDRAYRYDSARQDRSVPMAIREILYSRFTKANCRNKDQLIARYDEVSQSYGLAAFGK